MNKRKVILYIAMSLDGYIADEDGSIDFLNLHDSELNGTSQSDFEDFYAEVDTVVMGSKTYQQVVTELSPEDYPYSNVISYVLTPQSIKVQEENVHLVNEPIDALVKRLREAPGQSIWIVGGSSVVTPLIAANLIDEYILTTIPVILGRGIPLFQAQEKWLELVPIQTSLKNGYIQSVYHKGNPSKGIDRK
ncbi:dihydrofolate reductase family protein [Dellaglioa algida]|uniref:dihydrofolate reductase family protein n=1 Tax=Dellaglioa algida TaxID=105612 RepID=UPI0024C4C718|nr:dihydrofolate reductase family protein [Dellaglioa algida]MDK1727026.1 dihydrofolate reductase family protein [Dellaglioa algida]